MKTRIYFLLFFFLHTLLAAAESPLEIPDDSRQMVLVVSDHWDATVAKMWRFERDGSSQPWEKVGAALTVNLGRTGLAWGKSSLMTTDLSRVGQLHKKEGDGRAPAGLFPIRKAFGHPTAPAGYGSKNLPFLVVSDQQCVDDVDSAYYNQVVRPQDVGGITWTSAEIMKIDLYTLGLVVGHNCPQANPGLGSCIFFHLQRGPGQPTAGCTSMEKSALTRLLLWLESEKYPVVVQLPTVEFQRFSTSLPSL